MNAIMTIFPYKHNGMWVFDDQEKDLIREPFVAGADTILDLATQDIPDAENGFTLIFSAVAFPGHQLMFERREPEAGGYWYWSADFQMKGWLCPALFKYFESAPDKVYVQIKKRS